jgi:hypothetical protein
MPVVVIIKILAPEGSKQKAWASSQVPFDSSTITAVNVRALLSNHLEMDYAILWKAVE